MYPGNLESVKVKRCLFLLRFIAYINLEVPFLIQINSASPQSFIDSSGTQLDLGIP